MIDDQVIMLWADIIRGILLERAGTDDPGGTALEIARKIVRIIRAAEAVIDADDTNPP